MLWRISSFLLCQSVGALLGWWVAQDRGIAVGVVAAGFGWFVVDLLRGLRVVGWLRRADASSAPPMAGLWGEVVDRARRALRTRDQETDDAQQRLQEFLAAIQASPSGVVLLDPRGRIEWCNRTAAEQFGFDAERDMLQQIGNLVRDPAFAAYVAGNDFSREVVIPGARSSPTHPVRLSVHLHPYGQGRQLLLARDITAVEQAEAMRRDFVANVSHEIRTPLTVLSGFVETLQNLPLSAEDRARYLSMMAQQASRMQTLVSDLLTLSRLEGSPLPGVNEWTPVQALIAQCEQEARALAGVLRKSQELQFSGPAEDEIAGSQTELLSAFSNLVSNAIRYTPDGGSITVQWRRIADGRAEFMVRDSGPGIAPEHVARLTERFYRVDRSRSRETGGTGLGLAIVKHVVQRHGGELKIETTPGAGAAFSIRFPTSRFRRTTLSQVDKSERLATEPVTG